MLAEKAASGHTAVPSYTGGLCSGEKERGGPGQCGSGGWSAVPFPIRLGVGFWVRAHNLGCGLTPQSGRVREELIDASLSHRYFSLSLPSLLSPFLSKINKRIFFLIKKKKEQGMCQNEKISKGHCQMKAGTESRRRILQIL